MDYLALARNTAAFWLSAIDLFTVPMKVWAQPPVSSEAERQELQEEVWEAWKDQPEPLREVIFR